MWSGRLSSNRLCEIPPVLWTNRSADGTPARVTIAASCTTPLWSAADRPAAAPQLQRQLQPSQPGCVAGRRGPAHRLRRAPGRLRRPHCRAPGGPAARFQTRYTEAKCNQFRPIIGAQHLPSNLAGHNEQTQRKQFHILKTPNLLLQADYVCKLFQFLQLVDFGLRTAASRLRRFLAVQWLIVSAKGADARPEAEKGTAALGGARRTPWPFCAGSSIGNTLVAAQLHRTSKRAYNQCSAK